MLHSLLFRPVTKRHVEKRIVQTIPQHLYSIVADVDRYSEFLPFCRHSKVLRRSQNQQQQHDDNDDFHSVPHYMDATMTVGFPPVFTEEFVSRVKLDPMNLVIETQSMDSSKKHQWFDSLSSRWKLSSLPSSLSSNSNNDSNNKNALEEQHVYETTHVDFWMEMTVSDPRIVAVLDRVLKGVAGRQVEAFEQRCQVIPYNQKQKKHTDDEVDLK